MYTVFFNAKNIRHISPYTLHLSPDLGGGRGKGKKNFSYSTHAHTHLILQYTFCNRLTHPITVNYGYLGHRFIRGAVIWDKMSRKKKKNINTFTSDSWDSCFIGTNRAELMCLNRILFWSREKKCASDSTTKFDSAELEKIQHFLKYSYNPTKLSFSFLK